MAEKQSQNAPYKPPFIHSLIAGGVAGTTEICIMYPTDVVKTRAQLATTKTEGMITTMRNMLKNEGVAGMYRGILPPIMVETPKRAIKFAANDVYKPLFTSQSGKLSQSGAIGAGVSAGCTEAIVVVPFELVKIRLQDKSNAGLYKNTMDCVVKIAKNEGPLAFYKGLESTLWRHATWNGGYFGVIYKVQSIMPKTESKSAKMFYDFIAGAIAGTVGVILNTPFDVVKSRIQNQKQTAKYNWAIPALRTIAKEEGPIALYKGFIPKVVRLGPGGGILLVVYQLVISKLQALNHK